MKESEKPARCKRFAAVTRNEWQDHALRSGCWVGMLKVLCATCRRNVATSNDVICRRVPEDVSR